MTNNIPRIGVVSTSFPLSPDSISGVFVKYLAEALSRRAKVTIITPAADHENTISSPGMIRPVRYAPRHLQILCHADGGIPVALKNRPILYLLVPSLLFSLFFSCLRTARSVDYFQANWAIAGVCAGLAGKLTNTPVITTLRGEDVNQAGKNLLNKSILFLAILLSKSIVTVSEEMKVILEKNFSSWNYKFKFIPNGVPNSLLAKKEKARHNKKMRLVTVGSLIPRKGHEKLLEALIQIPKEICPEVIIIGDGPLYNLLNDKAKTLGIEKSVFLVGRKSHDQVISCLLSADVFVFTSYSEGRPNSVMEAMAASLPVIATNIPGVRELIVHEKNGYLYEPNDVDMLASLIQVLNQDRDKRAELGCAAKKTILHLGLSWESTADSYLKLFEKREKKCVA